MIEKKEAKEDMLEGFDLGEIQKLFDELKKEKESPLLESAVLFIGKSGAGKSALINYAAGGIPKIIRGATGIPRLEFDKEIAPTAPDDVQSCTLVPSAYEDKHTGLTLVDLPGFGETRGRECTVLVSLATQRKIKQASSIKQIVCVMEHGAFALSKGTDFHSLAHTLGQLIKDFSLIKDSVSLVISKVPPDITIANIVASLKGVQSQLKNKIADLSKQLRNCSTDIPKKYAKLEKKIEIQKNALIFVSLLIDNPNAIFLGNVFTRDLEVKLTEKIKKSPTLTYECFNFNTYDPDRMAFINLLNKLSLQGVKTIEACIGLPKDILRHQQNISQHEQTILTYKESIKFLQDPNPGIQKLKERQGVLDAAIETLNKEIYQLEKRIQDLSRSETQIRVELAEIDTDNEVLIYAPPILEEKRMAFFGAISWSSCLELAA